VMDDDAAVLNIARLIAGDDPAEELVFVIRKALNTLSLTVRTETKYPHRNELRARLKKLLVAIETIRDDMHDFDPMDQVRGGDNFFQNETETNHGLGDLAERAKRILRDIPAGKGRHKYFGRSEGATPQQRCALMVSVLWEEVRSDPPPNKNAEAQEACATLWKAAGGAIKRSKRSQRSQRKTAGKWTIPSDGASTEVWRDQAPHGFASNSHYSVYGGFSRNGLVFWWIRPARSFCVGA
jgi:hypothetical protein